MVKHHTANWKVVTLSLLGLDGSLVMAEMVFHLLIHVQELPDNVECWGGIVMGWL